MTLTAQGQQEHGEELAEFCRTSEKDRWQTNQQGGSLHTKELPAARKLQREGLQLDCTEPSHMSPRATSLVSKVVLYNYRLAFIVADSEL